MVLSGMRSNYASDDETQVYDHSIESYQDQCYYLVYLAPVDETRALFVEN